METKRSVFRHVITVVFTIIILAIYSLPAHAVSFNENYSLSGSSVDKMISIATAQLGRNGIQLGYKDSHGNGDAWCAKFVSDTAKKAGESAAIPYNAGCRPLYNAIIKAGGKEVSSPQKGDIVFFVCTKCSFASYSNSYEHTGIMLDNGTTYISGNSGGGSGMVLEKSTSTYLHYNPTHKVSTGAITVKYVRPNYSNSSSSSNQKPEPAPSSSVSVKTDAYYTIKNLGSGKMLNVYNNGKANGTNVTVYRADDKSGQDFKFISNGSGTYVLQPRCATSSALNVNGFSAGANSKVDIWTKSGHSTQSWLIEYNSTLKGYIIRSANNSSYVLTATGSQDSSDVRLASYNASDKYQVWTSSAFPDNPDSNRNATSTLAQTSFELKSGEQATLIFSFTGDAVYPEVQLDSSGVLTDISGSWSADKRSGSVTFKASAAGTGSITINLRDKNNNLLISKTASITVKLPETTPTKKTTTLNFNPSSISLDLTNQKSQEVTLTLGGDFSWGDQLYRTMSDPDVATVDWSSYESGAVFRPVITAKAAGETMLICSVVDKATGTTLATAQLKITVTALNYTIKYDANGGTNAPVSQTKTAGQALTITSDCPKREGYTFAGWATKVNGSAQYQPGDPYTADQDVTLYAVWTANNQVSLRLERDSFTIKSGEQAAINFTFTGNINSVDCEVKNTSICKYDDGEWNQGQHKGSLIVKALSPGTTDITIKLCDEKGGTLTYQTATITVEQVQSIATIELSTSSMNFSCPGETQEIRATTTPGGQNITWSKKIIETLPIPDRNPNAFTMRETSGETNRIRATEAGIAEVIASMTYAGNTYTASCVVTTPGIYVSALDTAVVKEGDRKIMNIGTAEQFSVYTIPSNQAVRWTSSDTSVATVSSNGTVTAVGSGFAEIRATIEVNGNVYSDSCYVLVPEPENNSTLVYVDTLSPFATDRYTGNEGDSFIDVIGRRNGNVDVNGNSYEHGLTAWVARWNYTAESSWVWNQYNLNGNYKTLTGKVVLIKSYNESNFDTQLTITGDGRPLYTIRLTPDSLPTEEFQINITGITSLKIEVSDNTSTKGGTAFGLANLALT